MSKFASPAIQAINLIRYIGDEKKTHFDTNHCMTILWSRDNDAGFCDELSATLRRSLD